MARLSLAIHLRVNTVYPAYSFIGRRNVSQKTHRLGVTCGNGNWMRKENRGIRVPRPPLPEQTKEWVDGEQRVFHHHHGPPIFHPLHRIFSLPLPLFLPLSRVISSFTFLVSAPRFMRPRGPPLTAFSRFSTLIHLHPASRSLGPLSISPVYDALRCMRVACSGNSCSVARLTTPRRNFEKEKEGERERGGGIVFDRFLFFSFPSLRREERRDHGKFSRRLVGEKFCGARIMHWDRA